MPVRHTFALLATLLVIIAARFYYVETFAIPLPYWDQWDAEGDYLLKPWIEGRLEFRSLWQPHNEHRIFPTRLLSLLVFSITGVWDNLVEARVNIFVAACIPLLIIGFLARQRALFGVRWLLLIVVIAQFSLPFAFENLLVGFQSQFYFLIIFTLLALILVALYPDSFVAMAGVLILSWLSVFTMASGILTPLAVAGVYLLQAFDRRLVGAKLLIMIILLAVACAAGYLIMPQIEANHIYRSRSISELIGALGHILAWPVSKSWFAGVALWIPAFVVVPWLLRKRTLTPADIVMAGCVIWSLAQTFAIAYGRGQAMTTVSSRYTELFSPGLIGNAWFAARFVELSGKRPLVWLGALFFVVFITGHIIRFDDDMDDIRHSYSQCRKQRMNVRKYLQTGDPSVLVQPQFEIPYPDAVRLRTLLDDPTIRRILPADLD